MEKRKGAELAIGRLGKTVIGQVGGLVIG